MRTLFPAVLALSLAVPAHAQQSGESGAAVERTARQASASALQSTLLDLLALRQAAHQAHWNVVGAEFYQAHEFYEELYASLNGPIDDLGARLRALDMVVDARPASVAEAAVHQVSAPAEGDLAETAAPLHEGWRALADALDGRIEETGDDMPTQDLLIGIAAMIEKQAWMLRAHLR